MKIEQLPSSYWSSKLAGRERLDGERGLFATESISKGDLLAVWGGKPITYEQLVDLPRSVRRLSFQVEDGIYLCPSQESDGDWVNHSCSPNAGIRGQISLVAIQDISPGEEITYDYAMTDGSAYDEFKCMCGSPSCRGYVSGNDWRRPELQERYRGYFSSYLQKRIADLQRAH